MTIDAISVDVIKCQRCGTDHIAMQFNPLTNPADQFTFWAMCPTANQPLLMALMDNNLCAKNPAKSATSGTGTTATPTP